MEVVSDCEQLMGADGATCAFAPGTACRSWCRRNAALWGQEAWDIFTEANRHLTEAFAINVDVLNPRWYHCVIPTAGGAAAAHAISKRNNVNGLFAFSNSATRPPRPYRACT